VAESALLCNAEQLMSKAALRKPKRNYNSTIVGWEGPSVPRGSVGLMGM